MLRMHAFNQSLRYDQRMYAADIAGSIAYAKSLSLVGILSSEEEAKITEGLQAVASEWENGSVRTMAVKAISTFVDCFTVPSAS